MAKTHGEWWVSLGLVGVVSVFGGCAGPGGPRGPFGPDDPETTVEKVALPSVVPPVHALQFDDSGDGSLMKPRGAATLGAVVSTPGDVPAGDAALTALVLAHPQVKAALGERYRLTDVTTVESGKTMRHGCCDRRETPRRLTFYSYSNRAAVEVLVKGAQVVSVATRAGYQPPETHEEIEEAVALVRQDGRMAGKLDGLDGHAILTEPGEGLIWNDPGYGHRVLWVTFSKGREGRPLYWALVDLDERVVLKAKEEPQP